LFRHVVDGLPTADLVLSLRNGQAKILG